MLRTYILKSFPVLTSGETPVNIQGHAVPGRCLFACSADAAKTIIDEFAKQRRNTPESAVTDTGFIVENNLPVHVSEAGVKTVLEWVSGDPSSAEFNARSTRNYKRVRDLMCLCSF